MYHRSDTEVLPIPVDQTGTVFLDRVAEIVDATEYFRVVGEDAGGELFDTPVVFPAASCGLVERETDSATISNNSEGTIYQVRVVVMVSGLPSGTDVRPRVAERDALQRVVRDALYTIQPQDDPDTLAFVPTWYNTIVRYDQVFTTEADSRLIYAGSILAQFHVTETFVNTTY